MITRKHRCQTGSQDWTHLDERSGRRAEKHYIRHDAVEEEDVREGKEWAEEEGEVEGGGGGGSSACPQ